ncbi:hypothetical protein ACJPQX_20870 [Vibrio vulnificus]|jgi:hypothetical protein|uniref:hypothetical protein n=1 Tax=Vibrio TaxID=662 RepID=UPI0015DF812C|nr:hypothetical protein [Vibrio parahaemolyticus]MCF9536207.1 hypothetical protein [Vibrio parahaemolyticus]MCF9614209.1 hypothetical protein [Vibrio parahaemolyticus]MCQ6434791.1 hypothetical protein [Vibrio parahaemolyticus]MCQ6443956.1 hypothetical protein [Vibrio parahaemolyticus]MDL1993012.1 hypothetical protein [Vibrio parahaemolyticus]
MRTIAVSSEPFTFESYFQAETYLEKQGYHCENEHWVQSEKPIATVVAKPNGVQIEFKNSDQNKENGHDFY